MVKGVSILFAYFLCFGIPTNVQGRRLSSQYHRRASKSMMMAAMTSDGTSSSSKPKSSKGSRSGIDTRKKLGLLKTEYDAANFMCKLFESFDNLGRHENNDKSVPGLAWSTICDDLEGLDPVLCPTSDEADAICADGKFPDLNPAVRKYYCEPLLEPLLSDNTPTAWYDDCLLYCTNFVSNARGGCCELECPNATNDSDEDGGGVAQ